MTLRPRPGSVDQRFPWGKNSQGHPYRQAVCCDRNMTWL